MIGMHPSIPHLRQNQCALLLISACAETQLEAHKIIYMKVGCVFTEPVLRQ